MDWLGNQFYSYTLNLLVTSLIGLGGTIAGFRYMRKVRRDDDAKKEAIEQAREEQIARHRSLQEMISDRFGTIDKKLTAYCESNHDEHAKFEKKMGRHLHDEETGLPYFLDM